jgi:hypothetical protein
VYSSAQIPGVGAGLVGLEVPVGGRAGGTAGEATGVLEGVSDVGGSVGTVTGVLEGTATGVLVVVGQRHPNMKSNHPYHFSLSPECSKAKTSTSVPGMRAPY